jgi:hypothetical protein
MDNNELHLIATAWVDFHQHCRPGVGDVDFRTVRDLETGEDRAAQKLLDLVVNNPGVALQIIDLIISVSSDEWILTNLVRPTADRGTRPPRLDLERISTRASVDEVPDGPSTLDIKAEKSPTFYGSKAWD